MSAATEQTTTETIIGRFRRVLASGDRGTFLSGVSSGTISTIVALAASALSVRLSVMYFGAAGYGTIVAISSLTGLLVLLNLGLPSALAIIGAQVHEPPAVSLLLRRTSVAYFPYVMVLTLA